MLSVSSVGCSDTVHASGDLSDSDLSARHVVKGHTVLLWEKTIPCCKRGAVCPSSAFQADLKLLRIALFVMLVAVWAYSTFCALMVMMHRRSGLGSWLIPIWSGKGLTEAGRKYRKRYMRSAFLGIALALAWILFVG